MASYELLTFDLTGERKKKQTSSGLTIDFTAVQIGASNLPITEGTAGALDINGVVLEGVATPVSGTDAANKNYVDGVAQGLDVKNSAKACTTANLSVTASGSGIGKTLTATANGLLTTDGVSAWTDIDNDGASADPFAATPASRVLVKNQTNAADNGIYAVKEKGDGATAYILIRAEDFDENAEVTAGAFTFVEEGSTCADTGFVLSTDDPISIDVTGQAWTQFSGAGSFTGGDGINISGSVVEVDLAATSGLEFATGQLQVDLAAAGAGTGGLTLVGNEIAVNAGDGIELTASGVAVDLAATSGLEFATGELRVDLAAAGAGTGGLALVGNEIAVNAGDGIELTASGVAVDLAATSGLEFATGELQVDLAAAGAGTGGLTLVGNEIAVNAGDGIELTASGVAVDLAATSGLEFATGELQVDLAAAGAGTGGLTLVGNEIAVDAGNGIELTAAGVAVLADVTETSTTEASAIRVAATGVSVAVDDSTIEGSLQGVAGAETLRVKAAGITETELNTSVAGDGLAGGGGTALSVNTGDAIKIDTDAVAVDFADDFVNDNAGAITVRQVVYIKADGDVDLAKNDVANLDNFELGIVEDASIAAAATGKITVRRGAIVGGYTGLTPGAKQYVSDATAGALTESLSGFVAGEFVYCVGRAMSATELLYDPHFEFEF